MNGDESMKGGLAIRHRPTKSMHSLKYSFGPATSSNSVYYSLMINGQLHIHIPWNQEI